MPKLNLRIPKYRLHRQSGQAIVTLCGRDILLGPHGTKASKLEYDRLIGEWLQQGRQIQPAPDEGELSVVELIAAYLHFVAGYYRKDGKPTSEVDSITFALRPVKALYGRKPCSEFGPIALRVVQQQMVTDGLSRRLINQRTGRIKRMFKWGASMELIPASIPQALAMVEGLKCGRTEARETERILPVDDRIVEATLPHLPDVLADMVRVQRLTGCRPAEVCMIRPCDIDRSGEVWEYRPQSHKTAHHGHQRVIFIGPKAQAILLRYLARDPQAHCFRPCDSEKKRRAAQHAARKTPLSCGNKPGTNQVRHKRRRPPGESYNPRAYHQAVRYGCIKAFPVPDDIADDPQAVAKWWASHRWAPNRLRHSAATEIRKSYGLEAAQTVLGHAKANITETYAERDHAKAAAVARQIG